MDGQIPSQTDRLAGKTARLTGLLHVPTVGRGPIGILTLSVGKGGRQKKNKKYKHDGHRNLKPGQSAPPFWGFLLSLLSLGPIFRSPSHRDPPSSSLRCASDSFILVFIGVWFFCYSSSFVTVFVFP